MFPNMLPPSSYYDDDYAPRKRRGNEQRIDQAQPDQAQIPDAATTTINEQKVVEEVATGSVKDQQLEGKSFFSSAKQRLAVLRNLFRS